MGALWILEFAVFYIGALTAYRVLMTWVYANTQSLLLAVLMHASYTGWLFMLYPAISLEQGLVWQTGFTMTLWVMVAVVMTGREGRGSRPSDAASALGRCVRRDPMRSSAPGRGLKYDAAPAAEAHRHPFATEVLPAGLRAIRSVLAGQRHDRFSVDAGALGECADGLLPLGRRLAPRSPTRQRRSFDFRRIRAKRWYIPIVVLMPSVNVAVYGLMRWLDVPLPAPLIQVPAAALLFVVLCWRPGGRIGWSD